MSSARRCWVQADLALNVACGAQFEGCNVAGKVEGVGAGGCVEILPAVGEGADITAVHFGIGYSYISLAGRRGPGKGRGTWWDQRVSHMCESWDVRLPIDHINT